MPRPCTVCIHAERPTIDQELADAISLREIAQHYGVSKSAVLRHQQHQEPLAVTDTVTVTGHAQAPAPAPCTCPCTRIPWDELAHDAQQLTAYMQKAQSPDQAWPYMKFYLMRFAALTASACAQSRTA